MSPDHHYYPNGVQLSAFAYDQVVRKKHNSMANCAGTAQRGHYTRGVVCGILLMCPPTAKLQHKWAYTSLGVVHVYEEAANDNEWRQGRQRWHGFTGESVVTIALVALIAEIFMVAYCGTNMSGLMFLMNNLLGNDIFVICNDRIGFALHTLQCDNRITELMIYKLKTLYIMFKIYW